MKKFIISNSSVYRWSHSALVLDVLGHPFGKVPSPQPFDGSPEEAKIIISDPVSPIGKELLASKLNIIVIH